MMQKGKDIFSKALQNSKGAGIGIGLISAGIAGAYGLVNAIFTGSLIFSLIIKIFDSLIYNLNLF